MFDQASVKRQHQAAKAKVCYLSSEDKRRQYWFGPRADAALLKCVQLKNVTKRLTFQNIQIFNFFNITSRVLYYAGGRACKRLRRVCRLWYTNRMIDRTFQRMLVQSLGFGLRWLTAEYKKIHT